MASHLAKAALLIVIAQSSLAQPDAPAEPRWGVDTRRGDGRCSMYDSCGRKGGIFGQALPCADNGKARPVDDAFRGKLVEMCGEEAWSDACCTPDQLDTLQQSLAQAEPLLALCPACRLNFRQFYCAFTCSPDQSNFVTVTATQNLTADAGPAVKSVAFHVDPKFGKGFFDSCRNVKFGATNGYAMDLIGGGAKDWHAFLTYMGTERPGLGSPFAIDFPQPAATLPGVELPPDQPIRPLNDKALSCSSPDPAVRCACLDCPDVCLELPHLSSPREIDAAACRVGRLSCFSFFLIMAYAVGLLVYLTGLLARSIYGRHASLLPRRLKQQASNLSGYDRVPLEDPNGEDGPESASMVTRQASSATSSSPVTSGRIRSIQGGTSMNDHDLTASYQPRSYALNTYLSHAFYRLGYWCARQPYLTFACALVVCALLNAGWARFSVERDPVRLWVAKGSASELAKEAFDSNFGPFFRTEQVFLSRENGEAVLDWPTLQWWANVEAEIRELKAGEVGLKEVCFAPTDPSKRSTEPCVVQSLMGWLGDSLDGVAEASWVEVLDGCATTPSACLPTSGAPLNPRLLLGGVPGYSGHHSADDSSEGTVRASEARAIVVTYVVSNSLDQDAVDRAEAWEETLRQYLERLQVPEGLRLSYSTGVSLEQELNNASNTDIPVVILSYLAMFFYVSLSLGGTAASLATIAGRSAIALLQTIPAFKRAHGRLRSSSFSSATSLHTSDASLRHLLIDSKFVLGLWGIAIVLLSVSTSVGLFSFLGIKVTLIIAEVIPFLVLAIGVDNVFILAHEVDRQNARAYASGPYGGIGRPARVARYGTGSHFATAEDSDDEDGGRHDEVDDGLPPAEERVARALGRMGPSILLSAACETVAFALGAVVGMPAVRNFAIYAAGAVAINAALQVTVFVSAIAIDLRRSEARRVDCVPCIKLPSSEADALREPTEGLIVRFIQRYYAPTLLKRPVKRMVVALFIGIFAVAWMGAREIKLGLDQRLALPSNSYLVNYFNDLDTYLDVGPPVYFVEVGLNTSSRPGQQALCGRFSTCAPKSIANVLEAERKRPDSSFVTEPPAVWLDDFLQWLNPVLESCCRVRFDNPAVFCTEREPESKCQPCLQDAQPPWSIDMTGLPEGDEFIRYLRQWLVSPTNEECPLGGAASYADAVNLGSHAVEASHVRTYHTPLKAQDDYINAFASAHRIAADLTTTTGARIVPYSVFFVFFDQYASIVATTRTVLALALGAVFLVTSALLGSWRTGAVVGVTVFMSLVSVMGIMGAWGVSLNALSLVNLVIAIGIAVEFCAHVARAFMGASGGGLPHDHPGGQKERDERAWIALVDVGSSVFSGITLTKLIGIAVLALTRSKLLEVYYFRAFFALIISGALHGLVFLPVLLSYQGGQGYSLEQDDEGWMADEIGVRYGQDRPFLADDDDDESVTSLDRV